jgi:membrane protease YdiL (CAAX protease family)
MDSGTRRTSIPKALGLGPLRPFHLDPLFWYAVAAGAFYCLLLALDPMRRPIRVSQLWTWHFFSLTLVQPVIEELVFRGLVQGLLLERAWGRRSRLGISNANLVTTLAFALAHFLHHDPQWPLAVIVPSLIFGFFRDRHESAWPAIALHVLYNACYFAAVGLPGAVG